MKQVTENCNVERTGTTTADENHTSMKDTVDENHKCEDKQASPINFIVAAEVNNKCFDKKSDK